MRSGPLTAFALSLLLAACQGTPAETEQPPSADDPIGTESGGAVVGESQLAYTHFGDAFSVEESVKAVELLADPGSFSEAPILVEGTVVDVCQKAGCWMVLSDGSKQIRVTMKDHGFSVAKDGTGSWARVQGTLKPIDLDPERVEHLEGESERPDVMPEKTGQTWEIVATGVAFQTPQG